MLKNRFLQLDYTMKILVIISLTNIPAILSLPLFYRESLGWILGTIGGAGNFYWLSYVVKSGLSESAAASKLKALKGFYFRFLALAGYAVLVVMFLKPDIISFGMGIFSVQMVIFLQAIYEWVTKNKYFRG